MPNFSIALTGLQADTVALNTIGNNLANLNTTAFKSQTTSFEDLFYQNHRHLGLVRSAAGRCGNAGVERRRADYTQGSLNTASSSTDMALSGSGFFLVQNNGVQSLTRAGDFQTDNNGNLITVDGESVMGYGVKNGVVNQNGGLVPIQIPLGATEAAQATTNISLTSTLDASAATGATLTSPVKVYDSLGTEHDATVTYTKTFGHDLDVRGGFAVGQCDGLGEYDGYVDLRRERQSDLALRRNVTGRELYRAVGRRG